MIRKLSSYYIQRRNWLILGLLIAVCSVLSVSAQEAMTPSQQKSQMDDPRLTPGRLLATGKNTVPIGPLNLLTYKLEEVALPQPVEAEIRGRKVRLETVLRLTITSKSIQVAPDIWIGDAALTHVFGLGPTKIATIIYDRSVFKEGAAISVSDYDMKRRYELPERLSLPEGFGVIAKSTAGDTNTIKYIRSVLRVVYSAQQPLIEIGLTTNRKIPLRNDALRVQIGKSFFRAGGRGYSAGVILTPEEFAQLKDGDEVIAFYGMPDRSGANGGDVWEFGPLNKSLLDR